MHAQVDRVKLTEFEKVDNKIIVTPFPSKRLFFHSSLWAKTMKKSASPLGWMVFKPQPIQVHSFHML